MLFAMNCHLAQMVIGYRSGEADWLKVLTFVFLISFLFFLFRVRLRLGLVVVRFWF